MMPAGSPARRMTATSTTNYSKPLGERLASSDLGLSFLAQLGDGGRVAGGFGIGLAVEQANALAEPGAAPR